ncbi:hypothetical protein [Methanocella paludicola]|nr:hypothetical protein [Methanocella paludicola]
MDPRKIWAIAVILLFFGALALAGPFKLPAGNQSMHDVQQSEQRNVSTGGAGIPGGKNPYFATTFPMPSPTVTR